MFTEGAGQGKNVYACVNFEKFYYKILSALCNCFFSINVFFKHRLFSYEFIYFVTASCLNK